MNRFFIATSLFEQMDPGQAQWEVPWSPSLSWNTMLLVFKSMLKIKEVTSTHRTTVWNQLSCYSVGSTPWDGHSLNERRAMLKKRKKGQYWKTTNGISCDQQCGKEWTSLSSGLSQVIIDWVSKPNIASLDIFLMYEVELSDFLRHLSHYWRFWELKLTHPSRSCPVWEGHTNFAKLFYWSQHHIRSTVEQKKGVKLSLGSHQQT